MNEDLSLLLTDVDALIARHRQNKGAEKFRSPVDYLADMFETEKPAAHLPWSKMHGEFSLRPGEVTIWAGDSGAGKSMLVGQMIGWLLRTQRAVIASMEMPPPVTLSRMIRQCCGNASPARDWVERWVRWAHGRLYIYEASDMVPADEVLAATAAAANVLGLDHIVIDSLMTVSIDSREGRMAGEVDFMRRLVETARVEGIHVHLVAHARKPDTSSRSKPTKFDIAGSANLTNLASNVVIVSKNQTKLNDKSPTPEVEAEPDLFLSVEKQRNGAHEEKYGLWFEPRSLQFVSRQGKKMPWEDPWQ
jgi:twinkle protein